MSGLQKSSFYACHRIPQRWLWPLCKVNVYFPSLTTLWNLQMGQWLFPKWNIWTLGLKLVGDRKKLFFSSFHPLLLATDLDEPSGARAQPWTPCTFGNSRISNICFCLRVWQPYTHHRDGRWHHSTAQVCTCDGSGRVGLVSLWGNFNLKIFLHCVLSSRCYPHRRQTIIGPGNSPHPLSHCRHRTLHPDLLHTFFYVRILPQAMTAGYFLPLYCCSLQSVRCFAEKWLLCGFLIGSGSEFSVTLLIDSHGFGCHCLYSEFPVLCVFPLVWPVCFSEINHTWLFLTHKIII